MNWESLQKTLYYHDGSLRDIFIPNTTREDWGKWVAYVNANYRIDWYNGKTDKQESQIDFSVILEYWNGNHDLYSTAKVYMEAIQINAHFFDDAEFENDISPWDFKDLKAHLKLQKYLLDIVGVLGKEVIITPEDEHKVTLWTSNIAGNHAQ